LRKLSIKPGEAANLATKYRLDFTEVRDILGMLAETEAHSLGLDKKKFAEILRKIFNLTSQALPSSVVDQAWSRMDFELGSSGSANEIAESFIQWYSENMFNREIREADLSSPAARSSALAKKFQVSIVEVDKIRAVFDSFDLNRSGKIDREEFQVMLMCVFKAKTVDDVPSERANRFWMEIKQDASLTISFPEFCSWYIRNFSAQDQGEDFATWPRNCTEHTRGAALWTRAGTRPAPWQTGSDALEREESGAGGERQEEAGAAAEGT
jgi:hypothetical protein